MSEPVNQALRDHVEKMMNENSDLGLSPGEALISGQLYVVLEIHEVLVEIKQALREKEEHAQS